MSSDKELALVPDPHHLAVVAEFRDSLAGAPTKTTPEPRRTRIRRQTWGANFSPDRFLRKDPNGWDRIVRRPSPRRHVRLGVHVGGLCFVTPEETYHRGAAVAALADWLVAHGWAVTVEAYWSIQDAEPEPWRAFASVRVKEPGAPLNMATLVKSCCDLPWARKVLLMAMIRHADFHIPRGWGYTEDLNPRLLREAGMDYCAPETIKSRKNALAWLEKTRKKIVQGVDALS